VGTIKSSYHDVDLSKLESTVDNDGRKFYRLGIEVHIALGARDGTLIYKVLLRGREIGNATIEFSYR
jgi:hypothetical protein